MTADINLDNSIECYLRSERLPHIWCSGCGIGITLASFIRGFRKAKIDPDSIAFVSGIGCSGRAAGYLLMDSFHTTHGRAIPFATGLKLANPALNVVVFSGDGDLATIGGNHLIHAARRNMDITCICVNNFNYGMTGGQMGCTTPTGALTTTSRYGNFEFPANLPYLMAAAGATYIARWTAFHSRQVEKSVSEAMTRRGFSFIEVLSPCPTVYGRMNKRPRGLDDMLIYKEKSVIRHEADLKELGISPDSPIILGKFVDIQRPSYQENRQTILDRAKESGHL